MDVPLYAPMRVYFKSYRKADFHDILIPLMFVIQVQKTGWPPENKLICCKLYPKCFNLMLREMPQNLL
jgi:hypothetical protein